VLDGELSKVDNFYSDRLQDAIKRCHELRDQLQELAEHRKIFHEAEDKERKGGDKVVMRNLIPGTAGFTSAISQSVQRGLGRVTRPNGENARQRATDKREKSQQGDRSKSQNPTSTTTDNGHPAQADDRGRITEEQGRVRLARPEEFSPELYQKYKRKLRVAVMEYYKELEVLKNYRVSCGLLFMELCHHTYVSSSLDPERHRVQEGAQEV
jgi:xenotropic and polytropic retrovirus receptor 1